MAANDGDPAHRVSDLFGAPLPAGTGAGGTPVPGPEVSAGPVVGNPVVSTPYASSQAAENLPRVTVTSGDTCAMSSDAPVPADGDPLTGLGLSFVADTGAGHGSVSSVHHPNAASASFAAQLEAARRPS